MFDLDLDKLKSKPPLRDVTFWIAIAASIALTLLDIRNGSGASQGSLLADAAPVTMWLGGHGYLRGKSVAAAGEVAKSKAIAGITFDEPVESNPPQGAGYDEAHSLEPDLGPNESVEDYA